MSVGNILPIVWVVGSSLSFITMQVFIKNLSQEISPQYVISLRSILLLLFNSFLVFSSDEYQPYVSLPASERKGVKYFRLDIKSRWYFILMLKRLFWNAVAINAMLSSLKYVHLSIANALSNTSPVLQFFVEAVYYKKCISGISLFFCLISFSGVMVIFNPFAHISNGESFNWYLILPLIGACANCLNWVYLHEMRDQFKEIVVLEYTYVSHLITSSLVAIFVGSMQDEAQFGGHEIFLDPSFYGQVIGMVLFAYLAHILRIKATFLRKPSEILAFNYIGLIYSILIDVLYYHTHLSLTTILGIALTSAGLMSKLVMDLCGRQEQAGPVVPPSK